MYYQMANSDLKYFLKNLPKQFIDKLNQIFSKEVGNNELIYDELSKKIWDKHLTQQLSEEQYRNAFKIVQTIAELLSNSVINHGICIGGSIVTGLALLSADVDLSIIAFNHDDNSKIRAASNLCTTHGLIQACSNFLILEFVRKSNVPIIIFHHKISKLKFDLSYNQKVNVRNSHLLRHYVKVDWRVRPLAIIIKLWAQQQGINCAREKTISSYSLILMLISFLQCGVKPAVLPCLQEIYKHKFNNNSRLQDLNYFEDLNCSGTFMKSNQQSLGELLIEFLKYYANFNYDDYVISVRLGKTILWREFLKQSCQLATYERAHLRVEEPFTLKNTAYSVYDFGAMFRIKRVFFDSYSSLSRTRELCSILKPC